MEEEKSEGVMEKKQEVAPFPIFPIFLQTKPSHQITQIVEFFHCHIQQERLFFFEKTQSPKGVAFLK